MIERCHNIPEIKDHNCGPDGPCNPDAATRDVIQTYGDGDCEVRTYPLRLGLSKREQQLFDCINRENTAVGGTEVDYYPLDRTPNKSALAQDVNQRHREATALYGEPHFPPQNRGPYKVVGSVTPDSKNFDTLDEGATLDIAMTLVVPRAEFERIRQPYPREGDIFRFWNLPFYTRYGQAHRGSPPRGGYFFEAQNVVGDGYTAGGGHFVQFKITLRRDPTYAPERKLFGDVLPPESLTAGQEPKP